MNLTQEEKVQLLVAIDNLRKTYDSYLNNRTSFDQVKKAFSKLDLEFFALDSEELI